MSENMHFDRVNCPEFFVTGVSVITTNQNGQAGKDIVDLWTKFATENIAQQIAGKVSDDVYCVYTDYESDHTGKYRVVLGCRVEKVDNSPDGLFTALIPSGDYNIYKPQGKYPESLINAWQQIWQSPIDRKYSADYEYYKASKKSFEETEVEIYLGVV